MFIYKSEYVEVIVSCWRTIGCTCGGGQGEGNDDGGGVGESDVGQAEVCAGGTWGGTCPIWVGAHAVEVIFVASSLAAVLVHK